MYIVTWELTKTEVALTFDTKKSELILCEYKVTH